MAFEELQGPPPGQRGVAGAVAAPLVAAEAVAGAGVDEDLDLRPGGADRLHVRHGDGGIGLAEVELHRAARRLVFGRGDAAAVPADRGGEAVRAGGAVPGD